MNKVSSSVPDNENRGYYIKNVSELLQSGTVNLRRAALNIVEAGIAGADPASATRECVSLHENNLVVNGKTYSLRNGARIFVIGAGKATYPIAKVLDEVLGEKIHRGFVVSKRGQEGDLKHIEMHIADHPLPSIDSLYAVERTSQLLDDVRPCDILIACFTGGSSSLFVSLVDGISLEDARQSYRTLLTCGANIVEINAVRKHISTIKGGRLARRLPAGVNLINLTVSDVIGERMDCITCPTVPDGSTFADALLTVEKYQLWERLPPSVITHLKRADAAHETVREEALNHLNRQDLLLVKSDAACLAAAAAAQLAGFHPYILSTEFEGESRSLAQVMVAIAREVVFRGRPFTRPCALIGGGETTVKIDKQGGKGGPNQEFSVAAAVELSGCHNIVAIGIDTDGTDGPTIHAGGLADSHTYHLALQQGINLDLALETHNVTPALEKIKHIITTGNTGTNVNDLKLILIGSSHTE